MHRELLASAAQWLRYRRQCFLIATERGLYQWGRPDILGVNLKRQSIEIEIKMTLADFRANFKKRSHLYRNIPGEQFPHQFYFFVPPELVSAVQPELPDYAGLLTLDTYKDFLPCRAAKVVRSSPVWPSKEIKVGQLAEMAKHMSGTLTRAFAAQMESSHNEKQTSLL